MELELVDDFIQIQLYFVTQLELKEKEKIDKYQDVARELRKLSKLSTIAPSTKFTPTHFFFYQTVVLNIRLRNPVLISSLVLFPFQLRLGSPNILTIP